MRLTDRSVSSRTPAPKEACVVASLCPSIESPPPAMTLTESVSSRTPAPKDACVVASVGPSTDSPPPAMTLDCSVSLDGPTCPCWSSAAGAVVFGPAHASCGAAGFPAAEESASVVRAADEGAVPAVASAPDVGATGDGDARDATADERVDDGAADGAAAAGGIADARDAIGGDGEASRPDGRAPAGEELLAAAWARPRAAARAAAKRCTVDSFGRRSWIPSTSRSRAAEVVALSRDTRLARDTGAPVRRRGGIASWGNLSMAGAAASAADSPSAKASARRAEPVPATGAGNAGGTDGANAATPVLPRRRSSNLPVAPSPSDPLARLTSRGGMARCMRSWMPGLVELSAAAAPMAARELGWSCTRNRPGIPGIGCRLGLRLRPVGAARTGALSVPSAPSWRDEKEREVTIGGAAAGACDVWRAHAGGRGRPGVWQMPGSAGSRS